MYLLRNPDTISNLTTKEAGSNSLCSQKKKNVMEFTMSCETLLKAKF